jgi:hypothetical protein
MRRKLILAVLALVSVALLYLLLDWGLNQGREAYLAHERRDLLHGVAVGWSKQQVIAELGKPGHVARSENDVKGEGYLPVPKFPVENEVLEYRSSFWKAYVYIDRRGRVSRVFTART